MTKNESRTEKKTQNKVDSIGFLCIWPVWLPFHLNKLITFGLHFVCVCVIFGLKTCRLCLSTCEWNASCEIGWLSLVCCVIKWVHNVTFIFCFPPSTSKKQIFVSIWGRNCLKFQTNKNDYPNCTLEIIHFGISSFGFFARIFSSRKSQNCVLNKLILNFFFLKQH